MSTIKNKEAILDVPEMPGNWAAGIKNNYSTRSLLRYPGGKTRGVDFVT